MKENKRKSNFAALSFFEIERALYPDTKAPTYPLLDLDLLHLMLLMGTKSYWAFEKDQDDISKTYFDDEFPREYYHNWREGFNRPHPLVTQTLMECLNWQGGIEAEKKRFRQQTALLIKDMAREIKLDTKTNWADFHRMGKLIKKNIMNPGQLSMRLLLGVNLWKVKSFITTILRSRAKEHLAGKNFDIVKTFVCMSNGIHESYVAEETSWNIEVKHVYKIMGSYLDFLSDVTKFEKRSIASMVIKGIKTPASPVLEVKKIDILHPKVEQGTLFQLHNENLEE